MNSYVAWGIFGIISGLIASFADVPLVMPNQSENLKLGGVCPWWGDVTSKRFKVSFWLSFLGQPGGYIVMWLLADMISNGNVALAGILKVMTLLGCYTGLMSHVVFCLKPLLYQRLCKKMSDDESNEVIKAIDLVFNPPMYLAGVVLWLGLAVTVIVAILTGALPVPKWCVVLNPIGSLIVLMPLKKCGVRIIGALGFGFVLLSVLLIIAGI
ncbi:MAG: DUF6796 family protein [Coprococcus eutactus]|jgi:hypothetical protein